MKKIIYIFVLLLALILTSCEMPTNNNDNSGKQDSSLDGIDISKYEMPQTAFLNDGHELNDFEKIAKIIIEEGTFVYQPTLDHIGYEIVLEGEKSDTYYTLFYSVDNIKIAKVYTEILSYTSNNYTRKATYQAVRYVKLFNDGALDFSICYKLKSSFEETVSTIYKTQRSTFNKDDRSGEFSLFRQAKYMKNYGITEEQVMIDSVTNCDYYFNLYNEKIGNKNNLPLSVLGFNNY